MATHITEAARHRIETTVALAGLLARVEHHVDQIGAAQYQALVRQLKLALQQEMPRAALEAVLGAYPSAAELYENLNYERSGLSRSPLEPAINAELEATQAIARAARRS